MNLTEATMKALQGKLYEKVELIPSVNHQSELYKNNVRVMCDVTKIKLGEILGVKRGVDTDAVSKPNCLEMTFTIENTNEVFTKVSDKEYGKCYLFLTAYFKDGTYFKAGDGNFIIELYLNSSDYVDFYYDDGKPNMPEYKIIYDKCEELVKSKGSSMSELFYDNNPYSLLYSYILR